MFPRNNRFEGKGERREIKVKDYETRRPPEKEMVFGIRAIIEAIDAGKTLDKILLRRDMTSTIGKELLKKLMGTTTPMQKVPVEKLNQYTDKNHQGAIAFLSPIEFYDIETLIPTLYEEGKTPLQIKLAGLSKILTYLVIGICVVIFAVQILRSGGLSFEIQKDRFGFRLGQIQKQLIAAL